jgi:hypothetical protein
MRWNEIKEGISVRDSDGNEYGKSKKAGVTALSQVAVSRCLTSLPCLVFPPLIMQFMQTKTTIFTRYPRLYIPMNLGVIGLMLGTALPVAVAIFPQHAEMSANKLEPQFHNLHNPKGEPIKEFYFNRGL